MKEDEVEKLRKLKGEAEKAKQEAKRILFEKTTNKSSFSPALRAKRGQIAEWARQGKNFDQVLKILGSATTRDELRRYCDAENIKFKR